MCREYLSDCMDYITCKMSLYEIFCARPDSQNKKLFQWKVQFLVFDRSVAKTLDVSLWGADGEMVAVEMESCENISIGQECFQGVMSNLLL